MLAVVVAVAVAVVVAWTSKGSLDSNRAETKASLLSREDVDQAESPAQSVPTCEYLAQPTAGFRSVDAEEAESEGVVLVLFNPHPTPLQACCRYRSYERRRRPSARPSVPWFACSPQATARAPFHDCLPVHDYLLVVGVGGWLAKSKLQLLSLIHI